MQHSPDLDVGDVFADPAFAALKARDAAFAVVRPGTRAVLWANAAAAQHWDAADAAALGRALFGARGSGWLDDILGGVAPGRAPRLARGGLARGFRMRAQTAMVRAWKAPDGTVLAGFAVPDAASAGDPTPDAWRRPAWVAADRATPEDAAQRGTDAEAAEAESPAPAAAEPEIEAPADASPARRGQLAVLRDRLNQAVDGAASLRLLWRTDASDAVTQIDAGTFARLGSPLRFESGALPDIVAAFDGPGAERLGAALAGRATWSGITLALPVADGAATAPLALSASPVFGPDRSFAGFRGFGIVDLSRLDLAPPRPRDATAAPGPAPAAVDLVPTAAEEPEASAAAAGDAPPLDPVPAAAHGIDDARTDDARTARADDAPPAPEAPAMPALPANVVHLRTFAATVPARFGTPPAQSLAPPPAAPMAPAEPEGEPEVQEDAGPSPDSDRLAFLALGEALRAQIDAPVRGPDAPVDVRVPEEAAAAEAASDGRPAAGHPSPLLDLLPMGLLVVAGGAPAFANAAAAARLAYPSPEAVVATGPALLAPGDPTPDALALRDGRGDTLALAARSVPVAWEGVAATLWVFGDEPAAGEAPARPADQHPAVEDPAVQEPADRDDEAPAGALLDRVDDAVALLDADGRIRRLNRRGQDWFGRGDADGALGRPFTELLAPESRAAGLKLLGDVRAQRDGAGAPPLSRDVQALTGAEAPVPVLLKLGRLGTAGFYATLRDVTALRRAEGERTRGERDRADDAGRLSGLLAKVNHEIRTPLSAILGFAEVMMDERFGPIGNPRYKDYLKDMHASGTQLVAMVGDLLDLSRIEAGEIDLDIAAVDVNRIVAETVAQMQPEAHRERVIMRTSLAGRLPSVLADERSARQIVRNLLSNAVKFNEPGGQVIVSSALSDAGTVLLRVRDTGVGMTDDEIAAALEPFGATASPRPVEGHGLGLPLTRALVGANGASMAIRSRPREGTLVEVTFTPAGAEPARRPA